MRLGKTWRCSFPIVPRPRWCRLSRGCGASSILFPVGKRCTGCRRFRRWRLSWPPAQAPDPTWTSRGGPELWTGNVAITSRLSTCSPHGCSFRRTTCAAVRRLTSGWAWKRSRPCARWRVWVWRLRGPNLGGARAILRAAQGGNHRSQRAGGREDHRHRQALAPLRRTGGSESAVPVRPVAPAAGDRLQCG